MDEIKMIYFFCKVIHFQFIPILVNEIEMDVFFCCLRITSLVLQ